MLMGVACGLSLGLLLLLYLGRQHQHIRRLTDAALGSSPTDHNPDHHYEPHHAGLLHTVRVPGKLHKLRKSWAKHHHLLNASVTNTVQMLSKGSSNSAGGSPSAPLGGAQ